MVTLLRCIPRPPERIFAATTTMLDRQPPSPRAFPLADPTAALVPLNVAGDAEIQSASAIGFDWDPKRGPRQPKIA